MATNLSPRKTKIKFGIGSRHFETNAQRLGPTRPLSVTSACSRDFVLASVVVYSRPWLIFNPQAAQAHNTRSYIVFLLFFFLRLCERSAERDMGHILLPNNRIEPRQRWLSPRNGLKVWIYKGLYGNSTVLLETSILLIFCE